MSKKDMKPETAKNPVRFLTVTTKGGSGKSTISQQVAATWLLSRTGSANLVELDDQNLDSQWMGESVIKTKQVAVEGDASFAIMDVTEIMAGQNYALDIGNQTAEAAISAMGVSKLLHNFNLIFIPVRDVGQDLINAERTIDLIREHHADAKIALMLNGLPRQTQDPNDRRIRAFYGEIFEVADRLKVPVLILPGIEGYGMSRKLGETLYEINAQSGELIAEFQRLAMEKDQEGDGVAARRYMMYLQVVAAAQNASKYIANLHDSIDKMIGFGDE